MAVWETLKRRRVLQFVGAYIAAGFIALEAVDQAVGHSILPDIAYPIVLIFYLTGIPGTAVLAWFHGEKGPQRPPAAEIWLQGVLLFLALSASFIVYRARQTEAVATDLGLDPRRVAVLYFEDLGRGTDLGFLADGLTEALIEQLAQVRTLDVISSNGVALFRDGGLSRDSIARALEAGSLIQGSVEEVGDQVRVTARLVDGTSGADLQRKAFTVSSDQLLLAKDSLARDVFGFLRSRLGEEIRLRERRAAASSTESWVLVQRAERLRKDAARSASEDPEIARTTLATADSVLISAQAVDPGWVEPVLLRAQVAYDRARMEEAPFDALPWIEAGIGFTERALDLSPGDAGALALRGRLRYAHWELRITPDPEDWNQLLASARQDLEAAVQADPTLAEAHITLSYLYYQVKDVPAALLAARRAYEEDAYLEDAQAILNRLFWGSLDLEQFQQARRWCTEGVRRFPQSDDFAICQLWLMATPALPADVNRAWELQRSVALSAPETRREYRALEAKTLVAGALARAGLADSARSVLAEVDNAAGAHVDPHQRLLGLGAYVLILIGDEDAAIDAIKRYIAANPDHGFERQVGTAWYWRELRDHPRFAEISEP